MIHTPPDTFFPWIRTNEATLSMFRPYGQKQRLQKGELLNSPDSLIDRACVVEEGKLAYRLMGSDGSTKLLAIVNRGGMVGICPAVCGIRATPSLVPMDIIALEETSLLYLTRPQLMNAVSNNPEHLVLMVEALRHMILALMEQVGALAQAPPRKRLLHLLVAMSSQARFDGSPWVKSPIYMSHQQIANTIGVTRVCVTGLMGALRSEGLIRAQDRELYFADGFLAAALRELDVG